jgi:putative hydrolase of the HAD superfamily
MSIKAALFDLGNVLLRFDFDPAFRRMAPRCDKPPDAVRRFFAESGLEALYDSGGLSSGAFYSRVRSGLGLRLSYAGFRALWNDIFTPVPGMAALVRRLARDKRLVLISNTNAMHFEYVRKRYPVLRI